MKTKKLKVSQVVKNLLTFSIDELNQKYDVLNDKRKSAPSELYDFYAKQQQDVKDALYLKRKGY